MELAAWIPSGLLLVLAAISRKWLVRHIEKGVEHRFDERLERLRTDLRKAEEEFKNGLHQKQAELTALRETVLSGRASRQALIDKRRLEACEKIWAATVALAPHRAIGRMMERINFKEAAKAAPTDERVRQLFKTFNQMGPAKLPDNTGPIERPFLSPLVWAHFAAYHAVVSLTFLQMQLLEKGAADIDKMLRLDSVEKLLRTALPHQGEFLDKYGADGFAFLMDELEARLFDQIQKSLDGADADDAALRQAAAMVEQVNALRAPLAKENFEEIPQNIRA